MLRFHRSLRCSHVVRIAGTVALILLVCAGAAHADLVGQHAGANQLILSGDGKIAFTSDDAQTRVWDVAATRELAALPGQVLAVSGDGQRVLCDRWNQGVNRYGFWRLAEGHWQRGTTVMQHIEKSPFIIDATFVNDEAVVMWLGRVERFAPDGTTRTSRQ